MTSERIDWKTAGGNLLAKLYKWHPGKVLLRVIQAVMVSVAKAHSSRPLDRS